MIYLLKIPFLKIIIKIVIIFFVIYFFFCTFLFFNQTSLIFFPLKQGDLIPKEFNNVQEVYFETWDHIRLNWWFIDNKSKKTIIFFHGNWWNISSNKERIQMFNDLWVNGFLFDYRWYGKSEWSILYENDIYFDGEAAYQYILSRWIKPEEIIIWWQSLGGALAIHTAQSKNIFRTIIESSFASMDSMASQQYPFIPTKLLLQFHFDSVKKIQNIISPILIIHSSDDEIIPIENSKILLQRARDSKNFLETRWSHNGWFKQSYKLYKTTLESFLDPVFRY